MGILSERKQLLFWIPAILLALGLMTLVYFQIQRPFTTRRSLYIVGVPERGAALFFGDKQCGVCHSVNGTGGRVAPDLSGSHPETPAMGWIVTVLWNHGPGMWRQIRQKSKPYPQLSPQQMADILAFLYQASTIDHVGDPAAGQQVFNDKGCSRCHSAGGTGGKTAPDLSGLAVDGDSSVWARAMLNHAGSMVTPITNSLGEWPQFSGNEMNDLIAYISRTEPRSSTKPRHLAGNAERGWSVFQGRCIQCHSVRGQGGKLGPELGPQRDLPLSTPQFASVMWNHAPAMLKQARASGISVPQLQGNEEMADLLTFLASLRYFEPTGSPLIGERVFADRGCAGCHGRMAEGTRHGPPLKASAEAYTTASFTADLWRHGPRMIDRAEELGISWPTLKATDIGDLVSFLNAPAPAK